MNQIELQSLSTVLALASFLGICFWAYNSKRKGRFDEDAFLPFDDDEIVQYQNKVQQKAQKKVQEKKDNE
ncbi:MAG: cbb3-type cytochrome c oxidase subunit 3 [Pseudomonadales bacterium]|jgi:cytochrome c oxidase cbb3-type subunit 4|nr:cbb3-type cytochrome c oxidase subunit 3 [Pseudomonadales bacterium]